MKFLIVLSAMVAMSMGINFYHTGNDNLDVDKVMQNRAVVKQYLDCYLDKTPCDALAQSYKVILEDSLSTACERCNDHQKHLWQRFLVHLIADYPEYYAEFQHKYDPNNVYIPTLQKVIAGY